MGRKLPQCQEKNRPWQISMSLQIEGYQFHSEDVGGMDSRKCSLKLLPEAANCSETADEN